MAERYILQIQKVTGEDFSSLEPEFKLVTLNEVSNKERFESEILPKVEGILATGPVNAELIAKAFKLKAIVVNGAGYDDIDVAAATALRIPVYNIPDVTAYPTAEMALTLMLSVSRRVTEMDRRLRRDPQHAADVFQIGRDPGHTLAGRTLGIIGLGNIGLQLGRICSAMRMNIVYTQRRRTDPLTERTIQYLPFKELLAVSDILSIHCPLNDDTRGMINEAAFRAMKEGAILINTARGAIVDQNQLIRFLKAGKLGGAGLDVFPNETEIHPDLFEMENVVLVPHFGTNTVETRKAMADRMIKVLQAACNGNGMVQGHLINNEILTRKSVTDTNTPLSSGAPDRNFRF